MTPPPGAGGFAEPLRRLYRHGLIYTAGEALGKGLTYLILIALATLLPVSDFGYLNVFLAVSGPVSLVVALGMPEGALRFYFRDRPFPPVLGTALSLIAAAALAVIVPGLLLRRPLAGFIEAPEVVVLASLIVAPTLACRLLGLAVARATERSVLFAGGKLAEPILLAAVLLAVGLSGAEFGLGTLVGAYVLTSVVLAVWWLGVLAHRPGIALDRGTARPLLSYSLPLVFHGLAMTGLASFDQIIVNQIVGSEAAGAYAFAYRFGMAQSLVALGLSSAWTPLAFAELRRPERSGSLNRLARSYGNLLLGAAALFALGLPAAARWVGGAGYDPGVAIIPLVVYAYLWSGLYGMAVTFLVYDRHTVEITGASVGVFAVNVALNYLLIPSFGIAGAAAVTVVSYGLLFAVVWSLVRRRHPEIGFGRLAWRAAACAPVAVGLWWWLA